MFLLVVLRVSQGKVGRVSRKQLTIAHSTFPHLTIPWGGGGINYIDLLNKLFFLALPQVGKVLDMINQARGCKTPGWQGNLAVNSKGCAGITVFVMDVS